MLSAPAFIGFKGFQKNSHAQGIMKVSILVPFLHHIQIKHILIILGACVSSGVIVTTIATLMSYWAMLVRY